MDNVFTPQTLPKKKVVQHVNHQHIKMVAGWTSRVGPSSSSSSSSSSLLPQTTFEIPRPKKQWDIFGIPYLKNGSTRKPREPLHTMGG